jgi:RNA polymerase sigma factor (sigma-70 family)
MVIVVDVMPPRGVEPRPGFPPLINVERLARAAQRGDPAAMDALVRALMPYVGRVCGAIALDRGEDAMQETLIAVLRNLRSLREPKAIHGWVRRIAVREAVRAARGTDVASLDVDDVPSRPTFPADVATAVDVRVALAQLTPEQRAILVLRDLDGLSEARVAELLGVPEGTVKSRLHRARVAFARRWEQ